LFFVQLRIAPLTHGTYQKKPTNHKGFCYSALFCIPDQDVSAHRQTLYHEHGKRTWKSERAGQPSRASDGLWKADRSEYEQGSGDN